MNLLHFGKPLVLNGAPSSLSVSDWSTHAQTILHSARALESNADVLPQLREQSSSLRFCNPATALGSDEQRVAFWLNVYNALFRHAASTEQITGNMLYHLGLFDRVAYQVGEHVYTLNAIEHGVLRLNKRAPNAIFRPFRRSDPRMSVLPKALDARIHFALNCGAVSCPPIRSYQHNKLNEQLSIATQNYFDQHASVDVQSCTLLLPKLCKYYSDDFGDRNALVDFAGQYLSESDAEWLRKNKQNVQLRFSDYDWTFEKAR